jgi:hypothetical protein
MYGPDGHRGVDFNRHPIRTPIPSWCSGRVVVVEFYGRLGQTVIIDRDDGPGFAGYCHMALDVPVDEGNYVDVGDTVGLLGNTGTSTTGAHLHATLEPTILIGTDNAIDPLPAIRAAVARSLTLAGGGTTPIGDPVTFDTDEKTHLDKLGQSIVDQILGKGAFAGRADAIPAHIALLRRDMNWMHQESPWSLKSIREALAEGDDISLTPEQVAQLSQQVVASVTSGISVALDENEAAVLDAVLQLPNEFLAKLKAKL